MARGSRVTLHSVQGGGVTARALDAGRVHFRPAHSSLPGAAGVAVFPLLCTILLSTPVFRHR